MFRLAALGRRTAARFTGMTAAVKTASFNRFYHGSSIIEKGRKSGSSALEPTFRDWSKNQLKRNAARRKEREAKVDFGKKKMKENAAIRKIKSPQMDEYIQKLQVELFPGVREMMLPEGSALLNRGLGAAETRDLMGDEEVSPAMFVEELREYLDMVEATATSNMKGDNDSFDVDGGNGIGIDISAMPQQLSLSDANKLRQQAYIVFKLYGIDKNFGEMTGLLDLLKRLKSKEEGAGAANVNIPITVYNEYLRVAFETGRYAEVQSLFGGEIVKAGSGDASADVVVAADTENFPSSSSMVLSGCISDAVSLLNSTQTVAERVLQQTANMDTWSWFVQSVAKDGKPDEALAHITRLERVGGLQVHTDMYNAVLAEFVANKRYDDATELWDRMHCTPDLILNNSSFEVILALCAATNQSERAFYVFDELRALGLTPDAPVFSELFRACAEAPHHISGYEDTIIEAMCLMEGTEIYPTSDVYDNLMYAFSAPGDYVSAEYYFWEMKRKSLQTSSTSYANLMTAYARNSALGLSSWGYSGRFLRRPEKLTEKQKMVRKVPPGKLSKMMSEDVHSDFDDEGRFRMGEDVIKAGAGRKKPAIFDDMDSTEGADMFMDQLREESSKYEDPPSIDPAPAPPAHGMLGGGFGEYSTSPSSSSSLPGRRSKNRSGGSALEQSLTGMLPNQSQNHQGRPDSSGLESMDMGAMDGDFQQMMSDPAAMEAMMAGLSNEERGEFNELLGQFGLSGDLDGIAEELRGGAVRSPVDNNASENGNEHSASIDVEARPLPTDPQLSDLFSGVDSDDPHAFDELLAQLGRIESESEGKLSLDKLMQQFMMAEAEAEAGQRGDSEDEEEEEEAVEASFRDKKEEIPTPVSTPKRAPVEYTSSRRIPEDCSRVFSAPHTEDPGNNAEPSSDAQEKTLSHLAGLLDGSVGNSTELEKRTQKSPMESSFEPGLVDGQKVFSQKAINSEWDMIEFGRVPNTDYSQVPVLQRRLENVEKAEAAYRYMQETEEDCPVTVEVLNSLLSCYTEALMAAGAQSVIKEEFEKHGVALNGQSYQHLVRMHLRKKDLASTLETMETMKSLGVAPTANTWGLVIDAFAARNKPVEALKVIDELAKTYPATIREIPDGYLKRTRMLCRKLAVEHPELPSDPEQWVRDVKLNRRKMKLASKSEIQPLRSLLYT